MTVHLSDPRPPFCSGCHNSPAGRYVDFDAMHDGGSFQSRETLAYVMGTEDLHLCEDCVRRAVEVLEFKPVVHEAQAREIRQVRIERDYWREKAKTLAGIVEAEADAARPRRPSTRKVAA